MRKTALFGGVLLALFILVSACQDRPEKASFERIETVEALEKHTREFEKRVEKVTDGVYAAIGFGLANSIMIEGDDGIIVVDTMECAETAEAVRAAFSEITDKPVGAVIYTHNHADHVFGASVFADDPDIPVYAHETTSRHIDRVVSVVRPVITRRSMRMFGNFLDENGVVNAGIGPRLNINAESTIGVVRPTRTYADELSEVICGIEVKLIHMPGETDDQTCVWLPEKKVLIAADNIYKTFPNLYTIRGTMYRDVMQWAKSLERMRALGAEYLVPCHSGPVSGKEKIRQLLTDYRDAIAYVHDQTIRGMNMGLTPDELVETIQLPPHLAKSPYLKEFYGTVEWSVRAIFSGNLGWFDGNPATLFPLSPKAKAAKMAELAGGAENLLANASRAVDAGSYQWALELTGHLLRLDPSNKEAKALRVDALTALGERQSNPNARHYYLTCAAELGQGLKIEKLGHPTPEMVHSMPLSRFFESLAVNLDAQKSADLVQTVCFMFPDGEAAYTVHIRQGVAEIEPRPAEHPDIRATVDSRVFKEMLAELRNPLTTIATEFDIEGGKIAFLKFMALFDPAYEK
ncbi:MAG TPA: alkyl sulfatase dimerization domain-containing protein [Desulfosalsimonadaceae bacterium]|nr:alkyl sulfatase dimerization domain-containing protein [Desulfosalsimonadaceae bacterium]